MDNIDKKILIELQKAGRESASNIAEKIDVSVPTITEGKGQQAVDVVDPTKMEPGKVYWDEQQVRCLKLSKTKTVKEYPKKS